MNSRIKTIGVLTMVMLLTITSFVMIADEGDAARFMPVFEKDADGNYYQIDTVVNYAPSTLYGKYADTHAFVGWLADYDDDYGCDDEIIYPGDSPDYDCCIYAIYDERPSEIPLLDPNAGDTTLTYGSGEVVMLQTIADTTTTIDSRLADCYWVSNSESIGYYTFYAPEPGSYTISVKARMATPGMPNSSTYTLVVTASSKTVSFSSNGSIIDTQTVDSGMTATSFNPVLDGYAFQGWYTDNTFSTLFDFTTPITQDITLFAKWEGNFAFTSEPTAEGVVTPISTMENTVVFDASASRGSLIVWDFGDGTTATGMYQTHYYSQPGTYAVKLLVYNDNGDVDTKEYSVTIYNESVGGGGFDVRLLLIPVICIIGGGLVIRRLL